MPEAAVHEDHRAISSKDNVGPAGKGPVMQPESITHSVQQGSDTFLWLRIRATDPAHVPAAMLFAD